MASFVQAAAAAGSAHCASVFCQAGSARSVAYQRLISPYGSIGKRAISARFSDEPIENPSAYLYRLASNLMLDRLRSDRRSGARDSAWSHSQRLELAGEAVTDGVVSDARFGFGGLRAFFAFGGD